MTETECTESGRDACCASCSCASSSAQISACRLLPPPQECTTSLDLRTGLLFFAPLPLSPSDWLEALLGSFLLTSSGSEILQLAHVSPLTPPTRFTRSETGSTRIWDCDFCAFRKYGWSSMFWEALAEFDLMLAVSEEDSAELSGAADKRRRCLPRSECEEAEELVS